MAQFDTKRFAHDKAYSNLFRMVKLLKARNPTLTKEDRRYGLYMTFSDITCGILDMRAPEGVTR